MDSSLQSQLCESFPDTDVYNALPHIDLNSVYDLEKKQSSARELLLNIISNHGLDHVFSLHLLHRHYDLPPGHAMVYEQLRGHEASGLPFLEICCPRSIDHLLRSSKVRGKFFFYHTETDALRAYEFTTEDRPDVDLETCSVFISDFIRQLSLLKMENVFALAMSSPPETMRILHEIEIPDYKSTLRVEKSSWVPDGFTTDWFKLPSIVDGIDNHASTFRQSSSGNAHAVSKKAQHTSIGFIEPATDSMSLEVLFDGEHLDQESPGYRVISKARELIASV